MAAAQTKEHQEDKHTYRDTGKNTKRKEKRKVGSKAPKQARITYVYVCIL